MKVEVPREKWEGVVDRFSMRSLAKSEDVFGEIILDPARKSKQPWDQNPLEKFAWEYEWYVDKNEDFRKMAGPFAEEGDVHGLRDYEFLKKRCSRKTE